MSEGYRKIFWGIFIATFNINIGIIKILPTFIGFIVISGGINIILENYLSEKFSKAKKFSNITALVLFIGSFLGLMGMNLSSNILLELIPIVYLVLELLLFYYLFEGSIEMLSNDNYNDIANEFVSKEKGYIIFFVIILLILNFGIVSNFAGYATFGAILFIILRITIMTWMSKLKNIYLNHDEPEAL